MSSRRLKRMIARCTSLITMVARWHNRDETVDIASRVDKRIHAPEFDRVIHEYDNGYCHSISTHFLYTAETVPSDVHCLQSVIIFSPAAPHPDHFHCKMIVHDARLPECLYRTVSIIVVSGVQLLSQPDRIGILIRSQLEFDINRHYAPARRRSHPRCVIDA